MITIFGHMQKNSYLCNVIKRKKMYVVKNLVLNLINEIDNVSKEDELSFKERTSIESLKKALIEFINDCGVSHE
jgi:hypothetical protein